MRRNTFYKRDWKDYFKSIKRYNWSFLNLTFAALEFILIFLIFKSFNINWLIILFLNTIFLFLISWKTLLIIIPISLLIIFINNFYENNVSIHSSSFVEAIVKKKTNSGAIINFDNKNIYIKTYQYLEVNDLISIDISNIKKIDNFSNNSFEHYLMSERTYFIIEKSDFKVVGYNDNLKRKILHYLMNGGGYYSRYVPLLLIGNRNYKNKIILDKMNSISILHLFTISGFHINLILFFIQKIFKLTKLKNKYFLTLIPMIIFPYIVLMNFPIAACRAFLFSAITEINKNFLKNRIHKLNILAITIFILIVINPNYIFSLSFIFSYLLTYGILILASSLNKKNLKLKIILVTWFFSSLLNIKINGEFHITSLITTIIFTPIISLSYLTTIVFFWLKPVIDNLFFIVDVFINIILDLKISIAFEIELWLLIWIYILSFVLLIIFVKKQNSQFLLETSKSKLKLMNW